MGSRLRISNEGQSKANSTFVLTITTLLYIINYMDRTVLAATLPLIKQDFGFSDAQLGWLGSIYFIMVAILTIPASILVDRWSRKKALAGMAVIWSIATWLTGMGRGFGALLHARAWVGIGEAGFAPGGLAYISGSFEEKDRGKVSGIFTLGAPLGLISGAALGGYIAQANILGLGWRAPYYFFAIPGLLLGILILFTKDYTITAPREYSAGRGFFSDIGWMMKIPAFWYLAIGYGVLSIGSTAVLQFMPTYFVRTRSVDVAEASSMFGFMFVFAIFGTVMAGIVADRWRHKIANGRPLATAAFSFISSLAAIGAFLADQSNYYTMGYIGFTIVAATGFAILPAATASVMDLAPLRLRSLSLGLMVFFAYIPGGLGPFFIGWLSDMMGSPGKPDLVAAFWVIPVFFFFGTILFYFGAKTYRSSIE